MKLRKENMKKILGIVSAIIFCGILFSSFTPSLDGRAVVAESGVMPEGIFARAAGYLPGDSISVTNLSTKKTVDILVIGSLDSSEGISILLSAEAGNLLGMEKNGSNSVKIAKRSGLLDEHVSGTAVIGGAYYPPAEAAESPAKKISDSDNKTDSAEESVPTESYDSEIAEPIKEAQNEPTESAVEKISEPIEEPFAAPDVPAVPSDELSEEKTSEEKIAAESPSEIPSEKFSDEIPEAVEDENAEPIEEPFTEPDVPAVPSDEASEGETSEEKIDAESPSEIPSEKFSDEIPEAVEDENAELIEERFTEPDVPAVPSDEASEEESSEEKISEPDELKADSPEPSLPAEQYSYDGDAIKVEDFSEEKPSTPFYDEDDGEPTVLNDESDLPKMQASDLKETLVENEPDSSAAVADENQAIEENPSDESESLFSEKTDEPAPEYVEEAAVENLSEIDTAESSEPLSEDAISLPAEETPSEEQNVDAEPLETPSENEEVPVEEQKSYSESVEEEEPGNLEETEEPEDAISLPAEETPSEEQNGEEEPLEVPSESEEVPVEEQKPYSESVEEEELGNLEESEEPEDAISLPAEETPSEEQHEDEQPLEAPSENEEVPVEEQKPYSESVQKEEINRSENYFERESAETESADDSLKSGGNVFDEPQVEENYEPIVLEPSLPNPPYSESDENEKSDGDTNVSVNNEINISETAVPYSNKEEKRVSEKQPEQKSEKKSKDEPAEVPLQKMASLNKGWYVQIAALPDMASAKKLALKYQKNYPMTIVSDSEGKSFRVLVGRLSMDEYGTVLNRFKNYGYKGAFLRVVE